MNITGANPIRVADTPTSGQPVEFRLNQRISAEVLKVSGDQVTLVIQGQQVVGKVAGGEDASLAGQKMAQFVVRGMVDGMLQLQLVKPEAGQSAATSLNNQWTVLALNLLQLNGLPINEENLSMGRALLGAGLPLNADLLNNMQTVLNGLGRWGQSEADLSASLMARGLPLSSGTLSLALQNLPSLVDSYQKLQSQLEALSKNSSAGLKNLVDNALAVLKGSTIDMGASPTDLMLQLQNSISVLGKSLESQLADALKNNNHLPESGEDTNGMLALAYLRRQLANEGNMGVAREIDRFMDAMRQMQFLNSAVPRDPTNPPWLVVNLPLSKNSQNKSGFENARIKVSYRSDGEGQQIDPENNRIIFSVDLDENNSLDVDLSMVQKRVGAWLTAPDEDWKQIIENELSSLKDGLENIGYQMQFARCEVKVATSVIDAAYVNRVNLEA